jgi:hypothetical protein
VIRLVAAALLIWEPPSFAVEALTVLPTITHRGWAAAIELVLHGAVAALAAAGALALWNDAPSAKRLGTFAIVAAVARSIQSVYWSALPNATMPGDEQFVAGVAIAVGIAALAVLHFRRSAQPSR